MIDTAERENDKFRKAAAASFLKHAQETINPSVTAADVREMLIQHILTEEIFSQVFDDARLPSPEQRREGALRAGGDLLHRQGEARDAGGPAALLRRDQERRRARLQPPREADLPQGHLRELLQGLQQEGRRPARRRLHAERDRALHDRERRLAVPEAFRQVADRQGCGNPRSRRRHRHLHHRADRAFPRPADQAALQISGGAARQRGGDPALLRRQPEHRGDLRRDHRQYEEFPNLCFVDTLDNIAALKAQKGQQSAICSAR